MWTAIFCLVRGKATKGFFRRPITQRGLARTAEGGRDFYVAGEVNETQSIEVPFSATPLSEVEKSRKIESKGGKEKQTEKNDGSRGEGGYAEKWPLYLVVAVLSVDWRCCWLYL